MTTLTAQAVPRELPRPGQSLTALSRADALRYLRHPLFLVGVAATLAILGAGIVRHDTVGVGVEEATFSAFFIGVLGFVVAHRLTSALRRSGDLPDTAPVSSQRRTLAMCVACLVPMAFAVFLVVSEAVFGSIWPKTLPGGRIAWFGDEPDLTIWAILVGDVVLASLGGPLLGVAVARWAPFRGSALLGVALLVLVVMSLSGLPNPYSLSAPWAIFSDEHLSNGEYEVTWVIGGVSPVWWCGYAASLCGLAVVAALLRDPGHRRRLLVTGGALASVGVGCLLLAMA